MKKLNKYNFLLILVALLCLSMITASLVMAQEPDGNRSGGEEQKFIIMEAASNGTGCLSCHTFHKGKTENILRP